MVSTLLSLLLPVGLAAPGEPVRAAPVATPAATVDTWPTWRGDAAQTGRAPGSVDPKRLTERWTAQAGDAFLAGAVVDATRVIAGSKDGTLYAWSRKDGKLLWKVAFGGSVEAPPLIVADVVVVGARSGHVRALALADGAPRWDVDLGAEITAAAAFAPPVGKLAAGVLVGAYDGRLHRLDLRTGASAWVYETGSYLYGSPAITGDLAVLGGCDGFVHSVNLADGKGAVRLPVEAYVGAAVAIEGDAYVGHFGNKVIAFDPRRGTLTWAHFERSFPYLSSPALTAEAVIVGGRDRVLHALDRKTGEALWWLPAGGKVDSSPVVVGRHVVVGASDGKLYVGDVDTGQELRALDVGAAISASPAVASGWIWVGSEDGVFHAFGPKGGG